MTGGPCLFSATADLHAVLSSDRNLDPHANNPADDSLGDAQHALLNALVKPEEQMRPNGLTAAPGQPPGLLH